MLLQDIQTHLATLGTLSSGGTVFTVRRNYLPDTPDAVVALEEFAAGPSVRAMGPSAGSPLRERAGLMVTVRSAKNGYDDARAVAEVVHQALDALATTLNGRRYFVEALHAPQLKEQDRNDRWIIEANYVAYKERG